MCVAWSVIVIEKQCKTNKKVSKQMEQTKKEVNSHFRFNLYKNNIIIDIFICILFVLIFFPSRFFKKMKNRRKV